MTIKAQPAKVLIIGCGPAGLGAIEQFKRKGFDVVAYDARDAPGGLWNFDPSPPPARVTFDNHGQAVFLSELEHADVPAPAPTPMYAGVTANTPRDIMPYRSHPYPTDTPDAPAYDEIHRYLLAYAKRYAEHIQLGRYVQRVRHNTSHGKRWLVDWTPAWGRAGSGTVHTDTFDFVVVANGSDSRPYVPYVEGLWTWTGEMLHSRWYRRAEDFRGKNILVVGSGPSSADVVRELGTLKERGSEFAPQSIVRAHKSKLRYDTQHHLGWSKHVRSVPRISIVDGRDIELCNGEHLTDIDVIIFATSYVMRFEFCQEKDMPFKEHPILRSARPPTGCTAPQDELIGSSRLQGGHRAHHLDENQLFYLPDPTIAFLLLHAEAIPWPFSEMQARVVAAYWSGTTIDLKPHPRENDDGHDVLVLGHPGEFEYAERLLSLIGEGGDEEVSSDGKWGKWPAWKKQIREEID